MKSKMRTKRGKAAGWGLTKNWGGCAARKLGRVRPRRAAIGPQACEKIKAELRSFFEGDFDDTSERELFHASGEVLAVNAELSGGGTNITIVIVQSLRDPL